MSPAIMDDDDWDRAPTALEAARYDEAIRRQNDEAARHAALEAERKKVIFGDCLMRLINLGMPETKARTMLGKWRSQAKDDARLVRVVQAAEAAGTPDPISYVTKALQQAAKRSAGVESLKANKWERLGWEQPRKTVKGPRWRGPARGEVWRDPFGKTLVMQAPSGKEIPTLDEDPGVDVEIDK